MDSFYNLFFVDEEVLKQNIQKMLLKKDQVSLSEIIKNFPIKKGIAELVGYISIAKNSTTVAIDEVNGEILDIRDENNSRKKVKIPKIIFVRTV